MKEIRVLVSEDIDDEELMSLANDINEAVVNGTLSEYIIAVETANIEEVTYNKASEDYCRENIEENELEEPISPQNNTNTPSTNCGISRNRGWHSGYLDGGWTV